jgi:hypothetical protein
MRMCQCGRKAKYHCRKCYEWVCERCYNKNNHLCLSCRVWANDRHIDDLSDGTRETKRELEKIQEATREFPLEQDESELYQSSEAI